MIAFGGRGWGGQLGTGGEVRAGRRDAGRGSGRDLAGGFPRGFPAEQQTTSVPVLTFDRQASKRQSVVKEPTTP